MVVVVVVVAVAVAVFILVHVLHQLSLVLHVLIPQQDPAQESRCVLDRITSSQHEVCMSEDIPHLHDGEGTLADVIVGEPRVLCRQQVGLSLVQPLALLLAEIRPAVANRYARPMVVEVHPIELQEAKQ